MDRYSFDVENSHLLLHAGLSRRSQSLCRAPYNELVDLMTLAGQGKVHLEASEYSLDDINGAIHALEGGNLQGRGVIVP